MSDVFISHSSKDAVVAEKVCGILEAEGISCWLAPRNIMPGDDWAGAITKAIATTSVFIIICSENSISSVQVPKEIALAGSKGSYIIPYRIDNTPLNENFEYHLSASHWITADIAHKNYKNSELIAAVRTGMNKASGVTVNNITNVAGDVNNYASSKPLDKKLIIGICAAAAVILAAVGIAAVVMAGDKKPADKDSVLQVQAQQTSAAETTSASEMKGTATAETTTKIIATEEILPENVIKAPVNYTFYDYVGEKPTSYTGGEAFETPVGTINEGYVLSNKNSYLYFNTIDFTEISFTADVVSGDSGSTTLYVYTNGNEYKTYDLSVSKEAVSVKIDVSDISVVAIGHEGKSGSPRPVLHGFRLTKSDGSDEEIAEEIGENAVFVPDEYGVYNYSGEKAEVYQGRNDSFSVLGESINSGYVMNKDGSGLMFNVSDFSEVSFTAGIEDSGNNTSAELYIYLDNEEHAVVPISYCLAPENITIDVSEASILRINNNNTGYNSPKVGIYNMRFTKKETSPEEETEQELPEGCTDVTVPDEYTFYDFTGEKPKSYNGKNDKFSVLGESCNSGYVLNKDGTYLLFNVKEYSEISFTLAAEDSGYTNDIDVNVILDGQINTTATVKGKGLPERYTIDISDASVLKIGHDGSYYAPSVAVYDIELIKPDASPVAENVIKTDDYALAPKDITYTLEEGNKIEVYKSGGEKFSVMGESYDSGYLLNKDGSYITFDVSGYNEALFTLGALDSGYDNETEIKIFLDDTEYDLVQISTSKQPVDFAIDVSNASTLKIGHDGYYYAATAALYNVRFK